MTTSSSKKLIVIKPNGNHSNKLQQNLHFEVFCKEHNIAYQNPTFNDIASLYVDPCNTQTNWFLHFLQIDLLGKLFRHSRVVKKVFSIVWILSKLGVLKLIRFDKQDDHVSAEKKLLKAFEKHDLVYVAGWRFRLTELSEKYRNEMSLKYAIKPHYLKDSALMNEINALKLDGYTLIGIHIRRGDYQKWKGGKYFYDDDVYQKQLRAIESELYLKGIYKYKFVIFSNEIVDFQNDEKIIISNENWYIDHHIMSLCDLLIGPPSTFTLWASYLGGVKLFHLYKANQPVLLN